MTRQDKLVPAQALAAASRFRPDLVITDLYMSRMDGLSLVRSIRALPPFRFTPILILSTESGDELKQRGRALGATGWIVKPFDPEQLSGLLRRIEETRALRSENVRLKSALESRRKYS